MLLSVTQEALEGSLWSICNMLLLVAPNCNTLSHSANTRVSHTKLLRAVLGVGNMSQYAARHYNALHYTATLCNAFEYHARSTAATQ